jgi:hypothetical protein
VASPHLGSWILPSSMMAATFNNLVPLLASRTGYQLVYQDEYIPGRPLLHILSDPELPFHQALTHFPNLVLLANIHNDNRTPYCTAAICEHNPYEDHLPVAINDSFPSIVHPQSNVTSLVDKVRKQQGMWPLFLFKFLFPLAAPVLVYMALKGKSHWWSYKKRPQHDNSWLMAFIASPSSKFPLQTPAYLILLDKSGTAGAQEEPTAEDSASSSGQEASGESPQSTESSVPHAHVAQQQVPDVRSVAEVDMKEMESGRVDVPVFLLSTTSGDSNRHITSNVDDVDFELEDKSHLHIHEGMVETPGSVRDLVLQIIRNLNTLPWKRVDVDCGHVHAHAGIVMRIPKKFDGICEDVLEYVVSKSVIL